MNPVLPAPRGAAKSRLSGNSKRKCVMKKHKRVDDSSEANESKCSVPQSEAITRECVIAELRDGPIRYFKTERGLFIRSSNRFYWQCETYVSRSHKSTLDLTLQASGYFSP